MTEFWYVKAKSKCKFRLAIHCADDLSEELGRKPKRGYYRATAPRDEAKRLLRWLKKTYPPVDVHKGELPPEVDTWRTCAYCKHSFIPKPKEKPSAFKKRKFCGNQCKLEALREFNTGKPAHNRDKVSRECVWCGGTKEVPKSLSNRPYCNRACMKDHYKSGILARENHPNWQGGITEDFGRDVLYPGYKEWRNTVYKRDGYRCVVCRRVKSNKMRAHHLVAVSKVPSLVCVIDNGVTLCEGCHQHVHYGKLRTLRFTKRLKGKHSSYWLLRGPPECLEVIRKLRAEELPSKATYGMKRLFDKRG